jgi:hypothetical protein
MIAVPSIGPVTMSALARAGGRRCGRRARPRR